VSGDRFPSAIAGAVRRPPALPPRRPGERNRLVLIGCELGAALDAGQLPATHTPPLAANDRPSRLIDLVQAPRPLVVWQPSRRQWLGRRLRRLLKRIL
jgi:hypothetical protein